MEEPVYIGVLILDLDMPWVRSLKEKRSIVVSLVERLRSRFPVSVARLGGQGDHRWERLGVVSISGDAIWLEELLNRVAHAVGAGEARIRTSSLTVEVWDV
ncbi:MAG: DUF503 domain-containing protein [Truepera sp.]|nr:DUF503 domain-containing protein [Truepera sp.]